jgi:hypothetical protein
MIKGASSLQLPNFSRLAESLLQQENEINRFPKGIAPRLRHSTAANDVFHIKVTQDNEEEVPRQEGNTDIGWGPAL